MSKISGFRLQVKGFTKWMSLVFNSLLSIFQDDDVFTDTTKIDKTIDRWIESLEN